MNKGLQTRREFFKNAAKRVLPILSIVTFLNSCRNPEEGDDVIGGSNGCSVCSNTCKTICGNECKDNVVFSPASCNGSCSGVCYNSCSNSLSMLNSKYFDHYF